MRCAKRMVCWSLFIVFPPRFSEIKKPPVGMLDPGVKKTPWAEWPAHGNGYSNNLVLAAVDRFKDWHPGCGRGS